METLIRDNKGHVQTEIHSCPYICSRNRFCGSLQFTQNSRTSEIHGRPDVYSRPGLSCEVTA
jgi:hypothetical protein